MILCDSCGKPCYDRGALVINKEGKKETLCVDCLLNSEIEGDEERGNKRWVYATWGEGLDWLFDIQYQSKRR